MEFDQLCAIVSLDTLVSLLASGLLWAGLGLAGLISYTGKRGRRNSQDARGRFLWSQPTYEKDSVGLRLGEDAMSVKTTPCPLRKWTATELRKLPPSEQQAILETAAAIAEREYHDDLQLTAFEAFGKEDLHGDSSSAESR